MRSNQHHAASILHAARNLVRMLARFEQGIDHCIARHEHGLVRVALVAQVLRGRRRGREVPARQAPGEDAVHFLREWIAHVVRAQAGFHVTDRNIVVERHQRSGQHARRVALHQHCGGCSVAQDIVDRSNQARSEASERLVGTHQIQIMVGLDAKYRKHLIEHFTVLRGGDNQRLETGRFAKGPNDRRHFDCFRTGAEKHSDFSFHSLNMVDRYDEAVFSFHQSSSSSSNSQVNPVFMIETSVVAGRHAIKTSGRIHRAVRACVVISLAYCSRRFSACYGMLIDQLVWSISVNAMQRTNGLVTFRLV
ncbi:hypothetical protein BN2475_350048 [Paraburkholderia ribeironis]|uniref:Uncharacterized protein n=1 Tax=Paraburkholderia ribeironis TaxID=1247936 RepID=A0A1N7S4T2_9BURK|nr:hypothetical protein BN2475_350048 [Paraburkholderia ribeironis]